jgi:hypothetical protein
MSIEQLNLKSGTWIVADCSKMKSEKNCHLVMMAPEEQKDDLLEAAVAHAVRDHSHEESDNLRKQIAGHMFETIEI